MSSLLLMLRAHLPSTQEKPPINEWLMLAASCWTGPPFLRNFTETGAATLRALVEFGVTTSLATGVWCRATKWLPRTTLSKQYWPCAKVSYNSDISHLGHGPSNPIYPVVQFIAGETKCLIKSVAIDPPLLIWAGLNTFIMFFWLSNGMTWLDHSRPVAFWNTYHDANWDTWHHH